MKLSILATAVAVVVFAGCSSSPKNNVERNEAAIDPGPQTTISSQRLATTFARQGIKIEWRCEGTSRNPSQPPRDCDKGEIMSIEVTAYATSNGNSESNRETAFRVAEIKAKAKLRHFIHEDITSTRSVNTLVRNVEKASDRMRNRIRTNDEIEMSDEEALRILNNEKQGAQQVQRNDDVESGDNVARRMNANNTVRTFVENVRQQAQGILIGVRVVDERIVDRQTVSSTIRWDQHSDGFARQLRRKFQ